MAGLFERVVVPIGTTADARATCSQLRSYADPTDDIATVVHVIEHTEGDISRAPMDARREDAEALLETVREEYGDLVRATELAYGGDIADEVLSVARDIEASAIVFTPHHEGRLTRLLAGDVAVSLLSDGDVPVVALPRMEEDDG